MTSTDLGNGISIIEQKISKSVDLDFTTGDSAGWSSSKGPSWWSLRCDGKVIGTITTGSCPPYNKIFSCWVNGELLTEAGSYDAAVAAHLKHFGGISQ